MSAYEIVLAVHNIMRWVVLLAGLLAAGRALYGWIRKLPWVSIDNSLGVFFSSAIDIQVLLGIVLYLLLSPLTRTAFADFGAAMGDDTLRFFAVEHIAIMIGAVVLVHAGRSISKRQEQDERKHLWAALFYSLAFVVLLLGTPWFRPLFPGF